MNHIPVIIGVSQFTQSKDVANPLDPLGLMTLTCKEAITDAGPESVIDAIDSVYVTNVFGWSYKDLPQEISDNLGLTINEKFYSTIGGNTPQFLVNKASKEIALGNTSMVLITGGESAYSVRRLKKGEISPNWTPVEHPDYLNGDSRPGSSELENRYGLFIPVYCYALFETALRKADNRSIDEHQHSIGRLYEKFSQTASGHPFSWQEKALSAEEIITPSPKNRRICYPYTLNMIANNQVDQSSALIVTTEEMADKLGVDKEKRVYPTGGADLNNIFHVTQRPELYNSPAIKTAAELALKQAGVSLEDIDCFDLYSCFPSMVQMAMREIGLSEDDPRDMTVTGGLPYYGAAFNNYSLHAIVTIVDRIRTKRSKKAMVLANGWYNTKQSIGVYGTEPSKEQWGVRDDTRVQADIDKQALPEAVDQVNGKLTVEAYTLIYDRNNKPEKGLVIGRMEDGSRAVAYINGSTDGLADYETVDIIGKTGNAGFDSESGFNLLDLI